MLRELFQKSPSGSVDTMLKEQDKKFNELVAYAKELEQQEDAFFRQLGLQSEELIRYMNEPSNFTEAEQAEIQRQIDEYEQKRGLAYNSTYDRIRLRKTYSERSRVQQHWMFVK